jgi:transcription elongation factor Elf1
VKELLPCMAEINSQWKSVTYYSYNERYRAHKSFYLELRYVLRKKNVLDAEILAARYITPMQRPSMKQEDAPIKTKESPETSAEPIYDSEDTESEASTQIDCICGGAVEDNKYVIACDMCNKWHHRKCAGLTVKQFQFLSKHQILTWHCKVCADLIKSETPNLLSKIEKFNSNLESFQNSKREEKEQHTEAENLQKILESVEN